MDQTKIGRFIAECRRGANLTQMQLAEKLGITNRAVSKWETGRAMPDTSLMLDLCNVLKISVNDLLSGEVVSMEDHNKKLEQNLLEMVKEKEDADRRLLSMEIFIGGLVTVILLALTFVSAFVPMADQLRILLIIIGLIPFAIGVFYAIRIEQMAGYYECAKCGYRYVPTYNSVLWAVHVNRTRHMRCPKCNEKSWQKKVLSKE